MTSPTCSVVFASLTHLASSRSLVKSIVKVPDFIPIVIWGEDNPATALSPSGTSDNTSFYPVLLKKPIYLAELLNSKNSSISGCHCFLALVFCLPKFTSYAEGNSLRVTLYEDIRCHRFPCLPFINLITAIYLLQL
jgi:hypothetical protein